MKTWGIIPGNHRRLPQIITGKKVVAEINAYYWTDEEMEANAHLIASAPDMYEALKALIFQFAMAVEHPYSKDKKIYEQAKKALAKAEEMK